MSLQQIIAQIHVLSGSNDLKGLHNLLKQATVDGIFKQAGASILSGLTSLDFRNHSLGYIFMLDAYARAHKQAINPDFLLITSSFLRNCNPDHIKLDPGKFIQLCHYYKNKIVEAHQAKHGILPLRSAISALTTISGITSSIITSIHADYFQLCLLSKCYSAALPLLDQDPTSIYPGAPNSITATDVLLYYYYGGLLETGLKRYNRAINLFLAAITSPTEVRNAITAAALNKYILLSLLVDGCVKPLPKFTPMIVTRMIKSDANMYMDFANMIMAIGKNNQANSDNTGGNNNINTNNRNNNNTMNIDSAAMMMMGGDDLLNALSGGDGSGSLTTNIAFPFASPSLHTTTTTTTQPSNRQQHGDRSSNSIMQDVSPSLQSIVAFIDSKREQLLEDGNYGLVLQLLQKTSNQKINALKQIYITLPLDSIAQQASFSSPHHAEMAVLKMIDEGTMHARIDEQQSMITFIDSTVDGYASSDTVRTIDGIIQKCMELSKVMVDREFALVKDKAYITKTELKQQQDGSGGGSGGGNALFNMPSNQQQQQKQQQWRSSLQEQHGGAFAAMRSRFTPGGYGGGGGGGVDMTSSPLIGDFDEYDDDDNDGGGSGGDDQ